MAVRKDKVRRDREFLAKRRTGYTAVLRKLGLEAAFGRVPLGLRNRIYLVRMRPAAIELDGAIAGMSAAAELKEEIATLLDYPLFDVMGNGQKVSFNELWWVVFSLHATFGPTANRASISEEMSRSFGPIGEEGFLDVIINADQQLETRMMMLAMHHSRIDRMFYGAEVRSLPGGDLKVGAKRIWIFGAEPRKRGFGGGEGPLRAAHQMAFCWPRVGAMWAQWDPAMLGLPEGPHLPVYVQSHVMQRLMERMPGERNDSKRGGVHMLLCDALVRPEVVQHEGGRYWVALRDFSHARLGYLLAEVVDGAVVVRTYQFLTMAGSPEAKRLYKALGVRRADVEHLRLDELATFVETDVAGDAGLRKIFESCGCGHLFDLRAKWDADGSEPERRAAEWIRGYLELGPGKKRAA